MTKPGLNLSPDLPQPGHIQPLRAAKLGQNQNEKKNRTKQVYKKKHAKNNNKDQD